MSIESSDKASWAGDQLDKAALPSEVRELVELLLFAYWEQNPKTADISRAAFLFSELAQGHRIVPDPAEKRWEPARPGAVVVRDEVRVRNNAYSGEAGIAHNGREGVIVAIRYGDIHVRFPETGQIVVHKPSALDKRVG